MRDQELFLIIVIAFAPLMFGLIILIHGKFDLPCPGCGEALKQSSYRDVDMLRCIHCHSWWDLYEVVEKELDADLDHIRNERERLKEMAS